MSRRVLAALVVSLGLMACVGAPEAEAPASTADPDADTAPASDATTTVPDGTGSWLREGEVDSAELHRWLGARAWRRWTSSSSIQPSPQGGSRVFLNPALERALAGGVESFPLGAIGVRELYEDDLITPRAINLTVKLTEDDGDGAGWLWVEVTGLERGGVVSVEEPAAPRCVGCHAAGVDQVQSGWPLR